MSISNIFTSNLPSLDLHGETSDTARVMINDYIRDSIKIKRSTFVIIHGIGTGVLKKVTNETLKKNKNVIEYGLDYYNEGSTIVRIKT